MDDTQAVTKKTTPADNATASNPSGLHLGAKTVKQDSEPALINVWPVTPRRREKLNSPEMQEYLKNL